MAGLDALRQYLADLAGPSQYFRDETGQLRPKPSALADGAQYASPADVETLQEPAFSPVDLIDPDILKAMYIPVSKKMLNALADGDLSTRVFSALHDRMPRVEIDDSAATAIMDIPTLENDSSMWRTYLSRVMGHPQLYENMPEMATVGVRTKFGMPGAQYSPYDDMIDLGIKDSDLIAKKYGNVRIAKYPKEEVLLHEGQHAVQERGGFARGGSPEQFVDEILQSKLTNERTNLQINQISDAATQEANMLISQAKNNNSVREFIDNSFAKYKKQFGEKSESNPYGVDLQDAVKFELLENNPVYQSIVKTYNNTFRTAREIPQNMYQRLAGEIESRDTAARMNMNALDRARTQPYTGYQVRADGTFGPAYDIGGDIPLEDYIVRREGGNALAVVDDYQGWHKPPMRDGGGAGHDLSQIYGDDIYGPNGARYYGTGAPKLDRQSVEVIRKMKGNPEAEVTIYRAVPKNVGDEINKGDWVTINKEYAKMHGSSWVDDGNYKIVAKKVKAKDIFTNGDSMHEWGYDPD